MTSWVGLDIGGSKLLAVAVEEGRVVARARTATERAEGPEAVLARACALVREVTRAVPARGLGVGFAGLVASDGSVSSSIMLPGWDGFPLADGLGQACGLPVTVENDANAAGYGEWCAAGAPPRGTHVLVTVGTGIGGAVLVDGRLLRGASGVAGEIGNMSIERDGPTCWCGSRGCLNMLASGSAMSARHSTLTREPACSVPELARRAAAGDEFARRVIEEGARALGTGLANVVQLLNPTHIALGGGVAELGEPWLALVRDEVRRRVFREAFAAVRIELCRLGAEAGAFGAAALARDAVEER